MEGDTFWQALALVLVFEGLLPFVSPVAWRRMFAQILQFKDGQIRFFGLLSVFAGLSCLWWLS